MNFHLPATIIEQQPTSQATAWLFDYETVRLYAKCPALRVHQNAPKGSKAGAGKLGRWFAIGDVILTKPEYKDRFALPPMQSKRGNIPGGFTHVEDCILPPGATLNVGLAAPLFGFAGGGYQAEWIPALNQRQELQPRMRSLGAVHWSSRYGNA